LVQVGKLVWGGEVLGVWGASWFGFLGLGFFFTKIQKHALEYQAEKSNHNHHHQKCSYREYCVS